jgi:hypothetical protein
MYYHDYLPDLAAAIARDRDAVRERRRHATDTRGRRRRSRARTSRRWVPPAVTVATCAMALLATLGPSTTAEPVPATGRDDGLVDCGIAALISPTPPTADEPCWAEWWRLQRYLGTLPRLP